MPGVGGGGPGWRGWGRCRAVRLRSTAAARGHRQLLCWRRGSRALRPAYSTAISWCGSGFPSVCTHPWVLRMFLLSSATQMLPPVGTGSAPAGGAVVAPSGQLRWLSPGAVCGLGRPSVHSLGWSRDSCCPLPCTAVDVWVAAVLSVLPVVTGVWCALVGQVSIHWHDALCSTLSFCCALQ